MPDASRVSPQKEAQRSGVYHGARAGCNADQMKQSGASERE
jgi:hypothetical protein